MDKLLLVDGNSIMNRAFYGVPDLTNPQGIHTNAIYGFFNILFRFIDEENPNYLAVAFDLHAPTFRHKLFDAYKGTRKAMPEELKQQVPYIKQLVQLMNIKTLELEGFEADDLLGTMAKRGQANDLEVTLLSGDRDLLQIADKHIKIRIPKTQHGKTTVEDYYPEDVIEKYHVNPEEFINLKALMGDSSDNIPGVPKVGAKTAEDLIVKYHSLDGVYESIDEISKQSIKQSLIDNKDLAYLCLKLARIDINAPVDVTFEDIKYNVKYVKEAYDIVKFLNLKSFYKKFEDNMLSDSAELIEEVLPEFTTVSDLFSFINVSQSILDSKKVVFIYNDDTYGFKVDEDYYFISNEIDISGFMKDFIRDYKGLIISDNPKSVYKYIDLKDVKVKASIFTDRLFCIDLAAYLINPTNKDYSYAALGAAYLNTNINDKLSTPEDYIKCVKVIDDLYDYLSKELSETNQYDLFRDVEMPLSLVLFEMENKGILVNPDGLKEYGNNLSVQIENIEKDIYAEAGHEFNISSPKQLGVILFEEMGMPYGKKNKTGYSTSAEVLDKLAEEYPFVEKILEYRGLTKLKSTYAEGLSSAIGEDGRIHSNFLQTVTATGRLSSAEPNLQNIPVRSEIGKKLRKVFIPKDGSLFADADYSQIELRVLAHMSKDKILTDAFINEQDIHAVTASSVFNIPLEEVTSNQRRMAKVVNFGIIYGMSSFSLAKDLNVSRKEADNFIKDYFDTYPEIKNFLDSCVSSATETGYSVSLYNRRRPIPELKASMFMQREFGKRVAMNAPIQGTAADIMKIAMIKVRDRLVMENLETAILLQVHDELLLEVPDNELEVSKKILIEEMENAVKLSVPLSADLQTGADWYEAK